MTYHSRSAFCRSAAQRLSRARLLEPGFDRIRAAQSLNLIGSSCRYCRFALLFLSQLTSPRAFLCTSHWDRREARPRKFAHSPASIVGHRRAPQSFSRGAEPRAHRSVASSGLHRTLCLFLFCQGIYARSGLWSMAHACCIAAR